MVLDLSVLASALWIILALQEGVSCVNKGYGAALNAMAPHLINTAAGMLTQTPVGDADAPHISLKIVPSKRIHLTPSEMNSLLFSIKQEIHRKVDQLEDELFERRHEEQEHLSAWALNQAPVYMPFRDTPKSVSTSHEPTLHMAVKKAQERAFAEKKAEKMAETATVPEITAMNDTKAPPHA